MPCENCNIQFTVFRRKKLCSECRRLYCNLCLTRKHDLIVCGRCEIFLKRPISKVDLLKLKPKDLIFYLQSKHISTTGCVEKEELVNMVIVHINNSEYENATQRGRQRTSSSDDFRSNPFDNIKLTCQNLFSNLTERLVADFNFETKTSETNQNLNNDFVYREQPRPRNPPDLPGTSNEVYPQPFTPQSTSTSPTSTTLSYTPRQPQTQSEINLDNISSTVESTNSIRRPIPPHLATQNPRSDGESNSDCCCSDDEPINSFRENYKREKIIAVNSELAGTSTNNVPHSSRINETDGSSITSSFEELGALRNNSDDPESWLFVDRNISCDTLERQENRRDTPINRNFVLNCIAVEPHHIEQMNLPSTSTRMRKILRRRSDSAIYDGQSTIYNSVSPGPSSEELVNRFNKRPRTCCLKCGKNQDIRKYIAKLTKQLEDNNSSEDEIKRQIQAFLLYLEQTTYSSRDNSTEEGPENLFLSVSDNSLHSENAETDIGFVEYGSNEGINVYATDDTQRARQFISLKNFISSDELEELNVKQLKEILILNRVDFKGCCEKTELLERVLRLWREYKSCPAVDKLPSNDLCKICMDAPIECIILECGHLATCTNCGKVLSECPICRHYIVRIVRFFRA